MMGMYFFKYRITTMQFNYWCSVCVGATVLLRDVLFAPPLAYYAIRLACLSLSVLLLYFIFDILETPLKKFVKYIIIE